MTGRLPEAPAYVTGRLPEAPAYVTGRLPAAPAYVTGRLPAAPTYVTGRLPVARGWKQRSRDCGAWIQDTKAFAVRRIRTDAGTSVTELVLT